MELEYRGYKPQILFFYSNDEKLEELLDSFVFKDPKYVKKMSQGDRELEYEYYRLKCYKRQGGNMEFARGHRATKIIIEESLYERLGIEAIQSCLLPLVATHGLIGSHQIEVF